MGHHLHNTCASPKPVFVRHKRKKCRYFVVTMDQKTAYQTVENYKGIDVSARRQSENEAITFNKRSSSLSIQLVAKFIKQLNTSKLDRHTSSSETQLETRKTKIHVFRYAQFLKEIFFTLIYIPLDTEQNNNQT